MMENGFSDFRLIIPVSMAFMGYLAFPGISVNLWQHMRESFAARKRKKICRRRIERQERLKKYWEIDMRNFK